MGGRRSSIRKNADRASNDSRSPHAGKAAENMGGMYHERYTDRVLATLTLTHHIEKTTVAFDEPVRSGAMFADSNSESRLFSTFHADFHCRTGSQ